MLTHSRELYERFMRIVVIDGAFSQAERDYRANLQTDAVAKCVAVGKRIDARSPWLCRISGKGGYVADAKTFDQRKTYRNVSLLDHLVSVARGAAVFAEIDLRSIGLPEDWIRRRVARQIALGFLHDADKILMRPRQDDDLVPEEIAGLMQRYHVDEFLREFGAETKAADMLSMIYAVETSRANRMAPGGNLLSNEDKNDCDYARFADRLESKYLGPNGVDEMLKELATFGGLRNKTALSGWRVVQMRSTHTPFLLDALQKGLSRAVEDKAGMPPLIEIHHDGELLAFIPETVADAAIDAAIVRATERLRLKMRVMTNQKGVRNVLDGGADVSELLSLLEKDPKEASEKLFVHVDLLSGADSLRERIDDLLIPLDLPPNYAGLEKSTRKHYPLWPPRGDQDSALQHLRAQAAALAIGLGCEEPKNKKLAKRVPDASQREAELVAVLQDSGHAPPEWLITLHDKHKLSRQTLLSAYAAGLSEQYEDLRDKFFDEEGLLQLWLRGDGSKRAGLLDKNDTPDTVLANAASSWLRTALMRRFLAGDEKALGRCHFTNIPVGEEAYINTKSGLEGVNVSAFSGREGRPEFFNRTVRQTLVSPPAAAEHRLRTIMREGRRGKEGTPAYVSSPSMMGLFASLNMKADDTDLHIDHYDLTRLETEAGKPVYPEAQTYGHRVFFARHASVPTKLIVAKGKEIGAITFARMMMQAALRLGRPVHVFKGSPTPNNAYVHFDFLPGAIVRGMGGASLRLEQVPDAIHLLDMVERIAKTPNISLEIVLRFADPETRFAAACEALVILNRLPEDKARQDLSCRLRSFIRSPDTRMTKSDQILIDYARAMTRVQAPPKRDASNSELALGMRVALEAVDQADLIGQTAPESLKLAIAGRLEEEFERSTRLAWRGRMHNIRFPRDAALEAATLFAERVWPDAFQSRPPAAKARRIALAIYQVAFALESSSYRARQQNDEAPEGEADQAADETSVE